MSLVTILRVVQIILLIFAFSMTLGNIYDRYFTDKTHSVTEVASLQTLEFPVILSIIVTPGFDLQALKDVGYPNANAYFWGLGRYRSGTRGWTGQMPNGETVSNFSGNIY